MTGKITEHSRKMYAYACTGVSPVAVVIFLLI